MVRGSRPCSATYQLGESGQVTTSPMLSFRLQVRTIYKWGEACLQGVLWGRQAATAGWHQSPLVMEDGSSKGACLPPLSSGASARGWRQVWCPDTSLPGDTGLPGPLWSSPMGTVQMETQYFPKVPTSPGHWFKYSFSGLSLDVCFRGFGAQGSEFVTSALLNTRDQACLGHTEACNGELA